MMIIYIFYPSTWTINNISHFKTGTIFRLKGSVLAMSFLDCNGALIPYTFESWKDANKEGKKFESKDPFNLFTR